MENEFDLITKNIQELAIVEKQLLPLAPIFADSIEDQKQISNLFNSIERVKDLRLELIMRKKIISKINSEINPKNIIKD